MVSLTEDTEPLFGISDARVLDGLSPGHGHDHQCPTIGSKNSTELLHRPAIVGDMLEDMAADDDIERLCRELEVRHIKSQVDVLSLEVCRSITAPQTLAKARLETGLRRKMQDAFPPVIEEVGFIVQEQPNKSMSLERPTVDALSLIAGWIPVGTEPA
jgi:hypothetical protein